MTWIANIQNDVDSKHSDRTAYEKGAEHRPMTMPTQTSMKQITKTPSVKKTESAKVSDLGSPISADEATCWSPGVSDSSVRVDIGAVVGVGRGHRVSVSAR